ncbi:hypothetical protein DEA06_05625 [Microbacterium sp. Gd 4-13]|uniref:hypothetical protein n=1 Tax=Microbacterium sp. Gd 4-13 TaxID=2173179 RepID=UPI000D5759F5|nr:hypothetical protein [Microbacterium sp. Gd 4-13]PVW05234.1 hypothetical protein DEA06_05625 [Microbacterium sp. Gd 4-13]
MADLTVIDDSLVVRMEGAVRILSQERELRIPLAHIVGVVRDPDPFFRVEGVRASPGIHRDEDDDEKSFWAVDDQAKAIIVILRDNEYEKLVVDVDDPDAAVRLIANSLD